ncbi:MAG: PAS domain S-box protein [Spirochaetes bacterium]|nr:PAS domain S-box protein [Spirochaetota bacterium]
MVFRVTQVKRLWAIAFISLALILSLSVYLVHRFLLLPVVGFGVLGDQKRLILTHIVIAASILTIIAVIYGIFYLRYLALRKMYESDVRFRLLFENSHVPIFIRSLDGVFVDVNNAMLELFGYARTEMIGMSIDNIYCNPSDRRTVEREVLQKGFLRNFEVAFKKKDGTVMNCIIDVQAWKDENGNVQGIQGIVRDVTKEKQLREELVASEERYRLLFQHAPVGIFHYDKNGVIVDCNEKFVSIIGSSRQALVGLNMPARLQDKKVLEQVMFALEGKIGYYEGIYRSITAEKETPVRFLTKGIFTDGGKFYGAIGIVEDLTESMAYREEGRKSEERFRTVFENAPLGVILTSLDGVIVEANKAFEEITKYPIAQLIGMNVRDITYSDNFSEEKEIMEDLVTGFIHRAQIVKRYVRKDGEVIWARITASLLHNREGKGEYVLCLVEDITERRKAREELAREKERLAVTLASIGDGVITTDTEGKVVLINRVAEELTGWKMSEALGKPLEEVFVIVNERTRKPCENPVQKVIESGGIVGLANHTVLIAKDGTERLIADSGAPIRDELGNIHGVVLVFRDITEIAKLEEELRKAQKLESIGTLAGGIAHDFNNLLTSIMGSLSLIKMKIDSSSEVYNFLQDAEHAARQAKELTQQLLTFSKGGAPVKKTVQLSGLLQDICSFSTRGSNVKCEYEIAGDLWPIDVDMGQFSQVINNMLINALQAMPQGGVVKVVAENYVKEEDKGDILKQSDGKKSILPAGRYVKIQIIDHGVGIPSDILPKIFDPYFTTKEKGSGLGLAIAYSVIARHDGMIDVESEVGKGSCFSIYLPASSSSVVNENANIGIALKGEGNILLMDDDENILHVTSKMLRQLGYRVDIARNGEDAVAKFLKAKSEGKGFDVVIMDLTVPGGMGGKECIMKLREIDPNLKALVSSGYSNDPVMSDFASYGFKGILMKPYRIEDLSAILQRVMKS